MGQLADIAFRVPSARQTKSMGIFLLQGRSFASCILPLQKKKVEWQLRR